MKNHRVGKTRTQVKTDYQEHLIIPINEVREDYDTIIELKMTGEDPSFWFEVISNAFAVVIDRQDVDVMENIDDIREYDKMLCELEEIMECSSDGCSMHLTINQLHKLLSATEKRKLCHMSCEPDFELSRLVERYENELKRLAYPYQNQLYAFNQVTGIAR
ncbi:hypothetical protein EHV15_35720 [Paenibacillus oralis]|uniref:Uncharacterized protein n=1 Tax=Paenibacillus oralis TaxID=2490856 RepID=A0A3P3TAL5_9BACL|nr:hypothetical protein [Paenibacillus oralis]RRJ54922.1 hypothetical protein EHV15_35720 [Paenibacillus oralis]